MAYSTPRTWTAGEYPTAAQYNQDIRDNQLAAFPLGVDAWTAWTPTLTNLTLGNGVVVAKYSRVGRTISWRFSFVLGTTSAVGTGPNFTLPVAAHADYVVNHALGLARFLDAAVNTYDGIVRMTTGNAAQFERIGGSGSASVALTSTAPFTWGTADMLTAVGQYEAAT